MATSKEFIEKEKLFCARYLVHLDAARAVREAKFDSVNPAKRAWQLLQKPEVQAELAEQRKVLMSRCHVDQDKIIAELAKIAFCNVTNLLKTNADGFVVIKDVRELPADDTAAISEYCTYITRNKNGTRSYGDVRLKFHSKKAALELLGRYLGIFERDNLQQQPDNSPVVNVIMPERNGKKEKKGKGGNGNGSDKSAGDD